MYIIYKDDKFVGYTDDKIMLKSFIKSRSNKYSYKKMKNNDIPKNIKENLHFHNYSLEYYEGYRISTELPLFLYEFENFYESIDDDLFVLLEALDSFLIYSKYLKFNNKEKECIRFSFEYIKNLIDDLTLTHEIIYDEVIDIVNYFNSID